MIKTLIAAFAASALLAVMAVMAVNELFPSGLSENSDQEIGRRRIYTAEDADGNRVILDPVYRVRGAPDFFGIDYGARAAAYSQAIDRGLDHDTLEIYSRGNERVGIPAFGLASGEEEVSSNDVGVAGIEKLLGIITDGVRVVSENVGEHERTLSGRDPSQIQVNSEFAPALEGEYDTSGDGFRNYNLLRHRERFLIGTEIQAGLRETEDAFGELGTVTDGPVGVTTELAVNELFPQRPAVEPEEFSQRVLQDPSNLQTYVEELPNQIALLESHGLQISDDLIVAGLFRQFLQDQEQISIRESAIESQIVSADLASNIVEDVVTGDTLSITTPAGIPVTAPVPNAVGAPSQEVDAAIASRSSDYRRLLSEYVAPAPLVTEDDVYLSTFETLTPGQRAIRDFVRIATQGETTLEELLPPVIQEDIQLSD